MERFFIHMCVDLSGRYTLVTENCLKSADIYLTILVHQRRAGMSELMDRIG